MYSSLEELTKRLAVGEKVCSAVSLCSLGAFNTFKSDARFKSCLQRVDHERNGDRAGEGGYSLFVWKWGCCHN